MIPYARLYLFLSLLSLCFSKQVRAHAEKHLAKLEEIKRLDAENVVDPTPLLPNRTVLLQNPVELIPVKHLAERRIAVIIPENGGGFEDFTAQVERYAAVELIKPDDYARESLDSLSQALKFFNTLIVVRPNPQQDPEQVQSFLQFIQDQAQNKDVILVLSGKRRHFKEIMDDNLAVIWMPEEDRISQEYAAMSLFGGLACHAKLKSDYGGKFVKGFGLSTQAVRLRYVEERGSTVDYDSLEVRIDAIMAEAIQQRAAPGGVIAVVHNGNMLFEKAYGYHSYDSVQAVSARDIFDLASITKISATTPLLMQLVDRQQLRLDSPLAEYLWETKSTDKSEITLRSLLLHEAGLVPFITFYRTIAQEDLSSLRTNTHSVQVSEQLYIRDRYYETVMWPKMLNSQLREEGKYLYSDLSLYILKEIIERITLTAIDQLAQERLYRPLGMHTAGFNPRTRFEKERIVPTEYDRSFRGSLLQGYVHDQGAAMAGGVAGHAGLFASANDLAIYGQLLLNRGQYGGERYFDAETVDLFTSRQSETSRRGLGFDRKELGPEAEYPSAYASEATFGHTGYTGTAIWIDPEQQLVFIFLSNRVHPEVSSKLSELAIRRRVLDAVYQALPN